MSLRPRSRLSRRAALQLVAGAVVAGLVPTAAAGVAPPELAPALEGACVRTAAPAAAAGDLYGDGTQVVRTEQLAGLTSVLVLEPRIAPGTRRRMLAAPGGGWCDAAGGFNAAWTGGGGRDAAVAYASVAAAPYFDGVTVKAVRQTAPDVYAVDTHALTNGVEATWSIATDADGVRTATWTATGFAVAPLQAEQEGLTALPGGTETYTRVPTGALVESRGLPTAASAHRASAAATRGAVGVPAVYTGPDGMKLRVSLGDSRVAVDPGVTTGVREADIVPEMLAALKVNYEEFLSWGLTKGWTSDLDPAFGADTGWVYVNDSLSLYCWACVFIADDFQIHMLSEVGLILEALGFTGYADDRKAFANVVGHEMFHNFQNRYVKPGALGRSSGRRTSTAYSEGTARFQETLHSYSGVSFAPKTLYTGGQTNPPGLSLDANHCNGYGNNETAFAAGPFPKTYNACYFWTSWYAQNGLDSFVRLIREGMPASATQGNVEEGLLALATAAPEVPVDEQLAFSAASALTGRDKAIAPASGGEPRDWGSFLFRLTPPVLTPGAAAERSLGGGGIVARTVAEELVVSLAGEGLSLYEVRDDGAGSTLRRLDPAGATVAAPAPGESVWVVAVNPTAAPVTATLHAE